MNQNPSIMTEEREHKVHPSGSSDTSSLCCLSSTSDDEFEVIDYHETVEKINSNVYNNSSTSDDDYAHGSFPPSYTTKNKNSFDNENLMQQSSKPDEAQKESERHAKGFVDTIVNDALLSIDKKETNNLKSDEKKHKLERIHKEYIFGQEEFSSLHRSLENNERYAMHQADEESQQLSTLRYDDNNQSLLMDMVEFITKMVQVLHTKNSSDDGDSNGEEDVLSKMQYSYLSVEKAVQDIASDLYNNCLIENFLSSPTSNMEKEQHPMHGCFYFNNDHLKEGKEEDAEEFFHKLVTFYFPYTILSSYLFFLSIIGKTEVLTYTVLREVQYPARNLQNIWTKTFDSKVGRISIFSMLAGLLLCSLFQFMDIQYDKPIPSKPIYFDGVEWKLYPDGSGGHFQKYRIDADKMNDRVPFYIEQNTNSQTVGQRIPQVAPKSKRHNKNIPSIISSPETVRRYEEEKLKQENNPKKNKNTQNEKQSLQNNNIDYEFLWEFFSASLEIDIESEVEYRCEESCTEYVKFVDIDLQNLLIDGYDKDEMDYNYTKDRKECSQEREAILAEATAEYCDMLCEKISDSFEDYLGKKLPQLVSQVYSDYKNEVF